MRSTAWSMSSVRVPGLAISRQVRRASATILPASRISPSSRCDFSSGAFDSSERNTRLPFRFPSWHRGRSGGFSRARSRLKALLRLWTIRAILQDADDVRIHRFNIAQTGDLAEQALCAVMGEETGVVLMVDLQTPADGVLLVVVALDQSGAAHIAFAGHARRVELYVVSRFALWAAPAPAEPRDDVLVRHVDQDRRRDRQVQPGEDWLEGLRLRDGARVAVEHEAIGAGGAVAAVPPPIRYQRARA